MSGRLSIKGYNVEGLTEEQVVDFKSRVDDDLHKMKREWDSLKEKNARAEEEQNSRYQDLRSALRADESARDSAFDGLKRAKERVRTMQQELEGMDITSLDVETASKEHADLVELGAAMASAQVAANFDGRIRDKNEEIRRLDEQREDATSELNVLNRQADFRAKLDMKRRAAEQKNEEAAALLARHTTALERATGKGTFSGDSIEGDVGEAIGAREKELSVLEHTDQESNRRLQHTESTLSFARKQLKEKETQAESIDHEVTAVLEGEFTQLDDAIADAERECKLSNEALSMLQNAAKFFEGALRQGREKHSCLTCGRGIKEDENEAVLAHMKEMIRKSQPAMQAEEQENLAGWQSQLQKYTELKPREAQRDILRSTEIPQFRAQIEEAEKKLKGLRVEAEQVGLVSVTQGR